MTIAPGPAVITLPELSQTVTVPSNSVVYICTDGGVATTSSATNGFSVVDVRIGIDGAPSANGAYRRVVAANTTPQFTQNIANWSFAVPVQLSAGLHTIDVRAKGIAGSNAIVSGGNASVLQGQLTIVILNR